MTSRAEPTNATLLKEIKAVRDEQHNMTTRLVALELDKVTRDATAAAYEKFKADEIRNKRPGITGLDGNLMRALLIALGVIVALVTILGAYSHGS